MKKILLVSHGEMAEGTKKAAEMIAGKSEQLEALCLSEDGDIEQFKKELSSKFNGYSKESQVIVVADLMGGSPYLAVLEMLGKQNKLNEVVAIAGMNLPLVLSLILSGENSSRDSIKEMIEDSKKYIGMYEESDDDVDF
ncbi:MAG: PTS sugar transporter subunit IIA [Anaerorhabdus sp.]